MGNPNNQDSDAKLAIAEQKVRALTQNAIHSLTLINALVQNVTALEQSKKDITQASMDLVKTTESVLHTNNSLAQIIKTQAQEIADLKSTIPAVAAPATVTNTVRLSQPTDSDKKTAPTRRNSI